MVVLHTVIAIVLIVLLIIKVKVDPVISLILGSLYLGLATGVGFSGTLEAIAAGFGEIMAEVGLLIGFGVLIGAMLHAIGAFRKMVAKLVQGVGAHRMPYALTAAMATIFPSIYVDVQVVLGSPVVRSTAPFLGSAGLPHMAGALGTGIFAGYVFVIPGLAAVSIAGLLDIPLGTWLAYGLVLGPLTAIVTTIVFRLLLRGRYWKPETDEDPDEALLEQESTELIEDESRTPPLLVCLLPILVPLVLIAFGAFADLLEFSNGFIAFLGNPVLALFVGLLMAYVLCRRTLGTSGTDAALGEGFHTTGGILLITGIGGSLGAVIDQTGLDEVLAGLFTADEGAPVILSILLAWLIRRRPAPGHRLGVRGRHHCRRDHRPGAGVDRRLPGRHRTGHRVWSDVRPAGEQQLLLDVQVAARPVDAGDVQDPDDGHLHRLGRLAAHGDGRGADRLDRLPGAVGTPMSPPSSPSMPVVVPSRGRSPTNVVPVRSHVRRMRRCPAGMRALDSTRAPLESASAVARSSLPSARTGRSRERTGPASA